MMYSYKHGTLGSRSFCIEIGPEATNFFELVYGICGPKTRMKHIAQFVDGKILVFHEESYKSSLLAHYETHLLDSSTMEIRL